MKHGLKSLSEEGEVGWGGYPSGAPSLLSSTYMAIQNQHSMIVGATKRPGLTAAEALEVRLSVTVSSKVARQ